MVLKGLIGTMDRSLWLTPEGQDITVVVRRAGNGTLPPELCALDQGSIPISELVQTVPAVLGRYEKITPPCGFVEVQARDSAWRVSVLWRHEPSDRGSKSAAIDALLVWVETHLRGSRPKTSLAAA